MALWLTDDEYSGKSQRNVAILSPGSSTDPHTRHKTCRNPNFAADINRFICLLQTGKVECSECANSTAGCCRWPATPKRALNLHKVTTENISAEVSTDMAAKCLSGKTFDISHEKPSQMNWKKYWKTLSRMLSISVAIEFDGNRFGWNERNFDGSWGGLGIAVLFMHLKAICKNDLPKNSYPFQFRRIGSLNDFKKYQQSPLHWNVYFSNLATRQISWSLGYLQHGELCGWLKNELKQEKCHLDVC